MSQTSLCFMACRQASKHADLHAFLLDREWDYHDIAVAMKKMLRPKAKTGMKKFRYKRAASSARHAIGRAAARKKKMQMLAKSGKGGSAGVLATSAGSLALHDTGVEGSSATATRNRGIYADEPSPYASPPYRAKAARNAEAMEAESNLSEALIKDLGQGEDSDVNVLCETYGLRREELGRLTGFSLRALAEWASGKQPSQPARRRLHEVRRLLDRLGEVVKPENIPNWLHQRNSAFENQTPLQVIELGEIDRLWSMVHALGSGTAD